MVSRTEPTESTNTPPLAKMNKKLFENSWLNLLTLVHPVLPISFWGPVAIWTVSKSFAELSTLYLLGLAMCGLLIWSLIEYLLHRFLFHMSTHTAWQSNLQFLLHENHHQDPKDFYRGLMPLFPAIIFGITIWTLLFSLVPEIPGRALYFGMICGYLTYDYLHFSFHHLNIKTRWWKALQRNHLFHHGHPDLCFGVSSPVWDHIFATGKPGKDDPGS